MPAAATSVDLHQPHFQLGQLGPESQAWKQQSERTGEYMGCVWGAQSSQQGKIPAWVGCFWGQLEGPMDPSPLLVTWVPCPTVGTEHEVKEACIWAWRDLVSISPLLLSSAVSLGRSPESLVLSILMCEMGRFENPYLKGCCMRIWRTT